MALHNVQRVFTSNDTKRDDILTSAFLEQTLSDYEMAQAIIPLENISIHPDIERIRPMDSSRLMHFSMLNDLDPADYAVGVWDEKSATPEKGSVCPNTKVLLIDGRKRFVTMADRREDHMQVRVLKKGQIFESIYF